MNLKSMIYIACCMAVMSCGPQKKKAMEETEVLIETSMGDMKVKLYNDTPKHRDNFIKLARAGAYDNILFHRVVRGFMVQTGDPALKPGGMKPAVDTAAYRYTIPAEIRAISIRKAHWRQPVWGMT
jgi:peptidylprolyl isomerase